MRWRPGELYVNGWKHKQRHVFNLLLCFEDVANFLISLLMDTETTEHFFQQTDIKTQFFFKSYRWGRDVLKFLRSYKNCLLDCLFPSAKHLQTVSCFITTLKGSISQCLGYITHWLPQCDPQQTYSTTLQHGLLHVQSPLNMSHLSWFNYTSYLCHSKLI